MGKCLKCLNNRCPHVVGRWPKRLTTCELSHKKASPQIQKLRNQLIRALSWKLNSPNFRSSRDLEKSRSYPFRVELWSVGIRSVDCQNTRQ